MKVNTNTKSGESLKDYIKGHISVLSYFELIKQTVDMLKKVQGEGIQVVLDMDKMTLKNSQLQFQLITEESVYEGARIKAFLKEITFGCVFDGEEDCSKVTEFLHFLDDTWNGVELLDIKRFIAGGQQVNVLAQANVPTQVNTYPAQMPGDGETGVLDVSYWENLERQYGGQSDQGGQAEYMGQPNNGETGVLDPSFWDTALNSTPSQRLGRTAKPAPVPKLVHTTSGRTVVINRPSFWVGKDDVDLLIDKDVISRKHAEIIVRGNSYFVVDNNSTNKTYVDGKAIPGKATVEIFNGTKIKFVDEEYTFYID
ncbi:MAG: FHA domain-containing protein [Lachnospiraceae bacterium]|nr:FHA domain-containing protein [Lachnospiraceae bacterium]